VRHPSAITSFSTASAAIARDDVLHAMGNVIERIAPGNAGGFC
jgi:hypothetical protein